MTTNIIEHPPNTDKVDVLRAWLRAHPKKARAALDRVDMGLLALMVHDPEYLGGFIRAVWLAEMLKEAPPNA